MMMMGKKEARNRAMPSQNARPGSDSFSTHDYQLNQQEETKKSTQGGRTQTTAKSSNQYRTRQKNQIRFSLNCSVGSVKE
jgi:hypothetical protein